MGEGREPKKGSLVAERAECGVLEQSRGRIRKGVEGR